MTIVCTKIIIALCINVHIDVSILKNGKALKMNQFYDFINSKAENYISPIGRFHFIRVILDFNVWFKYLQEYALHLD